MAVFFPLKTQLLTLFGASENSIGMAVEYFNIILAFFPVYMLSNMMNAVIRADGQDEDIPSDKEKLCPGFSRIFKRIQIRNFFLYYTDDNCNYLARLQHYACQIRSHVTVRR